MTHLHPDPEWLIDYAAGSLADSYALCVSAHLEHCAACRADVEKMACIGGAFFDALSPGVKPGIEPDGSQRVKTEHQFDESQIEQVLTRLSTTPQQVTEQVTKASNDMHHGLPAAFRTLAPAGLENLKWKRYGKNLSVADINDVDNTRDVALQRLEPGAAVAHHDHSGREITVVLSGSFSDRNGQYYPGDFIVKQPGEQHRPTASENTPCVCLSVTDAPVKFTGMLSRLLNPIMSYRHPR